MAEEAEELSVFELNDLRRRIVNGDDWSHEELKRALASIRIDKQRKSANSSNGKKNQKQAVKGPDLDDLL